MKTNNHEHYAQSTTVEIVSYVYFCVFGFFFCRLAITHKYRSRVRFTGMYLQVQNIKQTRCRENRNQRKLQRNPLNSPGGCTQNMCSITFKLFEMGRGPSFICSNRKTTTAIIALRVYLLTAISYPSPTTTTKLYRLQ